MQEWVNNYKPKKFTSPEKLALKYKSIILEGTEPNEIKEWSNEIPICLDDGGKIKVFNVNPTQYDKINKDKPTKVKYIASGGYYIPSRKFDNSEVSYLDEHEPELKPSIRFDVYVIDKEGIIYRIKITGSFLDKLVYLYKKGEYFDFVQYDKEVLGE